MAPSFFRRLVLCTALLCSASLAQACPNFRAAGDIVVGLRDDAVPFTDFETRTTAPNFQLGQEATGFSVALWQRVAGTLRVPDGAGGTRPAVVTPVRCDTIDAEELALIDGRIDVIISPLTITAARMASYDFSQQYISSGLAVAVPSRNAINFDVATQILKETVLSSVVFMAILGFLTFNLVMAVLIRWLLFSPEEAQAGGRFGGWARAMLEAVMRTFGLRGIGDSYKGARSKLFEIFLAVVGTALSAMFLGILTSAFVGSVGGQAQVRASALPTMKVATLHCSTAQALLASQYTAYADVLLETDARRVALETRAAELVCAPTAEDEALPVYAPIEGFSGEVVLAGSWPAAMRLLAENKVDAVLGDWVAMTYLSRNEYNGTIEVLPQVFRNEPYGWGISRAVPPELRRDIDRALIREMRDTRWRGELEDALGAGSVSPN